MIVATCVLAGLGLVAGLGLGLAAKFFAVEVDPRQEEIGDILPGANCGGCGYAGCSDFAKGVVEGKAAPDACPVGGAETAADIGRIMGITIEEKERSVALVLCQGDSTAAPTKFHYNGMTSCASAALVGGGDKLCGAGCLGLADCQMVCPFGAIEMTEGGIARVISERCTSCGKCVTACPKNIIQIVPASAPIHILCRNTDKGGVARKACTYACIGCKKCEKFTGDGSMVVTNALASTDYTNPPQDPAVIGECPNACIKELDLSKKAVQH
ncbi:MAG: RnfABCDGE type electron transport complex subunit B [bacterium]|nr:RnfABCDGE type electron transport complex subunit B [bacterium]